MSDYSRYVKGGVVTNGFWKRTNFTKSLDDLKITISSKYVKRPDLLAYDLYGRPDLMWFVLQYNDILNINEFILHKQITLPSPSRFSMGML
jgi:hypothetical protein